jgi:signal transduction histidine kinase
VAQAVVLIGVVILLASALYLPIQRYVASITEGAYQLLTGSVASSITTSMKSGDAPATREILRGAAGQTDVGFLQVTDSQSRILFDTFSEKSQVGEQLSDALTASVTSGGTASALTTRDDVQYRTFAVPHLESGTLSYAVRLSVPSSVIDSKFTEVTRFFILIAVIGCVIGTLAAYLLASRLTRPITRMTESALAIRSGNLTAYATITTRDELEQLNREFQRMVERLKSYFLAEYEQKKQALVANAKLEEANKQLSEVNEQKTQFLNAASHQLRTPLSVIHWSLSMLAEESTKYAQMTGDEREMLVEALGSTKKMVDLVNDLLDLSRIEQGSRAAEWQLGNAGTVATELVHALQPLATQKNLQLSIDIPTPIPDSYIDSKALYQIYNNFVDNAIKYTAQGMVRVQVRIMDNHVVALIQDTGIGMTPDEQSRLFTRFSRGSEASKMFANGTGLGMSVAKSLLELMGGTIQIQSEQGRGSLFAIAIPLHTVPPA